MRISDWSSDVCSSDLKSAAYWRPLLPRRLMVRLRILIPSIEVRILAGHPVTSDTLLNVLSFPWGNQHPFLRLALRTAGKRSGFSVKISPIVFKQPGPIQIGRASCRERVGQYGLLTGAAV